jgi:predicted Rossmann fold flavoprotein
MRKHLVVIGGGAAGFFCAINAAQKAPGLQLTILEKSAKVLSKVKVSGGGRCNVTHDCSDISEMSDHYPRGRNFVKKLFHQFFVKDSIEWFEERGVQLKTEPDGRMFPVSDSSQTIIDTLLKEATAAAVTLRLRTDVSGIQKAGNRFIVSINGQPDIEADYVCCACGGFPQEKQFGWLLSTGHTIESPVPSLFTFNLPTHPITKLMGLSVGQATIRIADSKLEEKGPLLITHWGLSGPAVLRLSAWGAHALRDLNYDFIARVNWCSMNEAEWRERLSMKRGATPASLVFGRNEFPVPQRLWQFLVQEAGVAEGTRWADLKKESFNKLVSLLVSYSFHVKGKTTFKEEFVTAGGISLKEIDPQTMESKKVAGLFFAGEICDVDGITGGYNFQFAWSSGFVAANAIAKSAMAP